MTIEERLERLEGLEKELVRARRTEYWLVMFMVLQFMGLVAIALAGAAWAWADKGKPEEVRAQKFVVEDANGKPRGVLGLHGDGWGLSLADETDKPRAVLLVSKDGPTLQMADGNGKTRLVLGVPKDGPRVQLWDENGKTRVGLFSMETSDGIAFCDAEGKLRAGLKLAEGKPTLGFTDKKGNTRAVFGVNDNDGGVFAFAGENGENVLAMVATSNGPMVKLSDENSKSGGEWGVINGKTAIMLRDDNGEARAVLAVGKDGADLGLYDAKGVMRAIIGTEMVETSAGRTVGHPESSIALYGPDGTLIWSAPGIAVSH